MQPHENMIYWFALPAGQTPVGRTEFVTVNADGTNVQWSNGAGSRCEQTTSRNVAIWGKTTHVRGTTKLEIGVGR